MALHTRNENNIKRTSGIEKKREPTEYCNFNVEKIVNKYDDSDEDIYV
jgi:hypothetical protein